MWLDVYYGGKLEVLFQSTDMYQLLLVLLRMCVCLCLLSFPSLFYMSYLTCVWVYFCVFVAMFMCLSVFVLKLRLCVNSKLVILCVYWVQRLMIRHVVGICYKRGCDTDLCRGIFYGSYAVTQVILWLSSVSQSLKVLHLFYIII